MGLYKKPVDYHNSIDFTLFRATFPLFGIITIPVSASARIKYGYDLQF